MALSAIGSGAPFSSCAQLGGRLPPAAARAGGSLLGAPPLPSAPRPLPRPGGLRRGPAAAARGLRGAAGQRGKRGSGARGLGSLGRGWRRLGEFPSKKKLGGFPSKKKHKLAGEEGGRRARLFLLSAPNGKRVRQAGGSGPNGELALGGRFPAKLRHKRGHTLLRVV